MLCKHCCTAHLSWELYPFSNRALIKAASKNDVTPLTQVTAPILQKTAKAPAPVPAPATDQPPSPPLLDGRRSHANASSVAPVIGTEEVSYGGGGSGLRVSENGNGDIEAIEDRSKAVPVSKGDRGGSLISESIFRGIAYGMVNGILLPPVMVSGDEAQDEDGLLPRCVAFFLWSF